MKRVSCNISILLLLICNVLFFPATSVAQSRWELIGPVAGKPTAGLPAPATPGKMWRLTDGGAAGAVVIDDGTKFTCPEAKTQKIALVTCPPYNARGDGSNDDTAEIQAAINSGMPIRLPATSSAYLVSATLTINQSNTSIVGQPGATIKLANSANTPVLSVGAVTNTLIQGLTIDGNQTNQSGCSGGCRGIVATASPVQLKILNNKITNTRNDAIYVSGATGALVAGNYIADVLGETSNGAGINFTGPTSSRFFTIADNTIERIGGMGIGTLLAKDGVVANNVIFDTAKTIQQQALILGYGVPGSNNDAERIIATGNNIHTTTLHGCIRIGGTGLVVDGNMVANCGGRGIVALTTNDGVTRGQSLRVINNTVFNPVLAPAGGDFGLGIDMGACDVCEISGNQVTMLPGTIYNAVSAADVTNTRIANNQIKNGITCIRILNDVQVHVTGNQCIAQTSWGVFMNSTTTTNDRITITNNIIGPLDAGASGGINVNDGTATRTTVMGNTVSNATAGAAIIGHSGTWVSDNSAPGADCTVISTATINPNDGQISCDLLQVSGTTTITAITIKPKGQTLTLEFLGVLQVTDGGNLLLSGNFTAGVGDTLVLVSDGSNWIEVSRSTN